MLLHKLFANSSFFTHNLNFHTAVLFQGGYESFGDYEPHTGDPQYDLEYDRSYYKMPEMVRLLLQRMIHSAQGTLTEEHYDYK